MCQARRRAGDRTARRVDDAEPERLARRKAEVDRLHVLGDRDFAQLGRVAGGNDGQHERPRLTVGESVSSLRVRPRLDRVRQAAVLALAHPGAGDWLAVAVGHGSFERQALNRRRSLARASAVGRRWGWLLRRRRVGRTASGSEYEGRGQSKQQRQATPLPRPLARGDGRIADWESEWSESVAQCCSSRPATASDGIGCVA